MASSPLLLGTCGKRVHKNTLRATWGTLPALRCTDCLLPRPLSLDCAASHQRSPLPVAHLPLSCRASLSSAAPWPNHPLGHSVASPPQATRCRRHRVAAHLLSISVLQLATQFCHRIYSVTTNYRYATKLN